MLARQTLILGITLIVLCATAPHPAVASAAADLPASVRYVLNDVGRLIDQKAYDQAIEKLLAFQAKGGPAPADAAQDTDAHRHPMTYFVLGNCHLMLEQYKQAEKDFNEVVRRQPDMVNAWLNLAKTCYEQAHYNQAAGHFAQAYERASEKEKKPETLYYCAAAYLMAQQFKPSITAFERLMAAHADQIKPEWKAHWVHALISDGQSRRALPYIKEVIAQTSGEEQIRWQEILIHQYLQLKMTAEAAKYTQGLTRQSPGMARWWKLLGQIRLNAGDYAQALGALTIYGFLTPLTVEEQKLWADLNFQLGIPAQAAPVYKALLAEKPNAQTLKSLVMAYRQLGRPEDALARLETQDDLKDDPDLMMLRADLCYELKRFDEAAQTYLAAARRRHARTGQAWLMAGYAAWQNNEIETSRRAFKHAAGFDSQRKTALLAMRQLERIN